MKTRWLGWFAVGAVCLALATASGCGGSSGGSASGSGGAGEGSINGTAVKRIRHNFNGAKAVVSHEAGAPVIKSVTGEVVEVLLDKITEEGIEPAVTVTEETVEEAAPEETASEETASEEAGESGGEEMAEEDGQDAQTPQIDQPSDEIVIDAYDSAPSVDFTIRDPNTGTWYIAYGSSFLFNGIDSCKFFKIIDESKVECVDSEIFGIEKENIKFGVDGTIYYYVTVLDDGRLVPVLRKKSSDGTIGELTHEYVTVEKFFPLNNGEVYILGYSNDRRFIRKVNSAGGLESIVERADISDVYLASDESLLVSGFNVNSIMGIAHISPSGGGHSVIPLLNQTDINGDGGGWDGPFCKWIGSNNNVNVYCVEYDNIFNVNFQTGAVTIAHSVGAGADLKYYKLLGDKIYYYAITAGGFVLETFNVADSSVDNMLEGISDTIEFYKVSASEDGYVYFTGLRFSDNKIVVGQINPDKSVTYLDTVEEEPAILETAE